MFACIYIPNVSADAAPALVECAGIFSPRVEVTGAGTVVFDVEGLERLFGGYAEIAEKILEQARAHRLEPNIAIASNADTAACAARGFGGVTVIQRGTEAARLRDLPLHVLGPPVDILEALHRWGIRTVGAFATLPAVQISERLGQEGVKLHKLAQGTGVRPIAPHVEALRFVEVMELDYEILTIEPLTFILSRMLEQICSRLRARNLATHEVRLALGSTVRILNLPLPVRNSRLLTKLFILDLEAHPSGHSIQRVEVEAFPTKPRIVQNGLFVPLSPEPEKLELTLARLKAVVGEDNVGCAEILDTHRPDAFRIRKFVASAREASATIPATGVSPRNTVEERIFPSLDKEGWTRPQEKCREASLLGADGVVRSTTDNRWLEPTTPPYPRRGICLPHGLRSLSLRLFRPPFEATVQLGNGLPIWIAFHGMHGSIATASGPWRTSGDWWRPTMWDREEWDIEAGDALYRIYYDVHLDRWYAQGVYD